MKVEDVPAELLEILDRHAGKLHSRTGSVATALAEILTAYEALRPSYTGMLQEWSEATGGDHLPLEEWAELRWKLAEEEYTEWCEALQHFVDTGDAKPMAKESADLMYVIVGAAARPGINTDTAFREVHRSNMTKILLDGSCITRADGKILKPLTYQEADMTKAVK